MRRITTKNAKEGMKLGRAIYDSRGFELVPKGATITSELMQTFSIYEVTELFIEDWRVADVPVQPLIAPELESMATQALRTIPRAVGRQWLSRRTFGEGYTSYRPYRRNFRQLLRNGIQAARQGRVYAPRGS